MVGLIDGLAHLTLHLAEVGRQSLLLVGLLARLLLHGLEEGGQDGELLVAHVSIELCLLPKLRISMHKGFHCHLVLRHIRILHLLLRSL